MGSVIKKRRKRMAKKKHRKLLRKTRHQRRNKKWGSVHTAGVSGALLVSQEELTRKSGDLR